ncbi:peptidase inhibitor family I36 protein [Streptomyces rubiginosohelvolus]|uniref:peptidase inhibitor family I36 protein n=1 Tax=Streptomyces rubiginosohelvolus TaxID=67362 RepID=UPI00378B8FB9
MIKKTVLTLTMALAALAPMTGSASSADSPVREITGRGTLACPKESLCLYQDTGYNAAEPAKIWIITGNAERLSTYDANDRTSSVYLNAPHSWKAKLYRDTNYEGGHISYYYSESPWGDDFTNLSSHMPEGWNDEVSSVELVK